MVARGGAWAVFLLLLFHFGFIFGLSSSLLSFQVQTRFRVGKGGRRGRRSLLVEVATTALAIRFRAWRHCGRRNSS
ncbi:hypothetical protein VIGAN_03117500, partial [Vigna angularis var. angularis]